MIAHFVKGNLIISFPMTNSLWVTLHILWKAVSTLIISSPMTNSMWVTLHILWKESHHIFFLWQKACSKWHSKYFDLHSQHTSIYEYLIWISGSEHIAISFPCLPFTSLYYYRLYDFISAHPLLPHVIIISLSLIFRWVTLVYDLVLIFISVCMLVCRSDDTVLDV